MNLRKCPPTCETTLFSENTDPEVEFKQNRILVDDLNRAFTFANNFEIVECSVCLQFSKVSKIHFFEFWKWFFRDLNLSEPEIDIIWYREAYIYRFDQFKNLKNFMFFSIFIKKDKKNIYSQKFRYLPET